MNHLPKCKGAGTLDEAESHLFLLGTRLHRCDVAGRKELGSRPQRCLVWWGSWQCCHCGYESSSTLSWLRQTTCPCSLERMASSSAHPVGLAETLHLGSSGFLLPPRLGHHPVCPDIRGRALWSSPAGTYDLPLALPAWSLQGTTCSLPPSSRSRV